MWFVYWQKYRISVIGEGLEDGWEVKEDLMELLLAKFLEIFEETVKLLDTLFEQ